MARPGYNEDNSLNVAPTGTPVGRPNPHTSTGFSVNDNAGTGTTTGRPNPHTDTGFSGGQTLAGGGNNPGYQDNFFPPNNQGNQDIIPPPNTGDGDGETAPLPGSGSSGGSSLNGYGNLLGNQFMQNFLGKNSGGTQNVIDVNNETYGQYGEVYQNNLNNLESKQLDFTPTIDLESTIQDKVNNVIGFKALGGDFGLNDQGLGYTSGSGNFQTGVNVDKNGRITLGGNLKFGNAAGGLIEKYADGGPVEMGTGIESLIDPSDWRVLQSILAAGENPDDYADGGQVMPATSIDPTADDYFLKEFYKYMKRFLPGYDKEQDYYRQEKNRERMKREAPKEEEYQGYDPESPPPSEKYPTYDPDNPNHFMVPSTPTLEAAEGGEVKPFGGTRENVMDQVEAFDNAPVHMEEPMVGMYGEKVPLTIARKVQNYMEGLDPVKRDMIQEMMNMFQVKKQQEKMQQMEEDSQGGFFGPQPNEYGV
ncbi:MAG TPA: hypothetical protein DEA82_00755 [Flavobacteriaceae bacterium]|nr:hypothetical protein [Flavobacteriaceae bacterium]